MSDHRVNKSKYRKALAHLKVASDKQQRGIDLADAILIFVDSEGIMNAADDTDCNITEIGFVIALFWRAGKAASTNMEHCRRLQLLSFESEILSMSLKFEDNQQHGWVRNNITGIRAAKQRAQGVQIATIKNKLFDKFCEALESVRPPTRKDLTADWLKESVIFIYKNGGQGDLNGLDTRWCDDLASTLGVVQFDIDEFESLSITLDPYLEPKRFIPMHHGSRVVREATEAYTFAHKIICDQNVHVLGRRAHATQAHCVLADCMEALYSIVVNTDAKFDDMTKLTEGIPHPRTIPSQLRTTPLQRRMPSIPRWAQNWYNSAEYKASKRQKFNEKAGI